MPSKSRRALIPFRLKPATFRDLVRRLAADSSNVKWSTHALDRMSERGISDLMAMNVLREGYVKGEVEAGKNKGEWKGKLVLQAKGRREAGVVCITIRSEKVLVKTVEWEDLT